MKTRPTLFTNAQELQALEKLFEMDGGEITEEHEQLQEELLKALNEKTDSCVEFINVCHSNIDEAKKNIERMKMFIDAEKKKIDDFSRYVEFCMDVANVPKFVGNFYSIKRMKGSKKVEVREFEKIPMEYITVIPEEYKVDKKAVADAIKRGEEVDGVSYVEGKPTLKIGVKAKKD